MISNRMFFRGMINHMGHLFTLLQICNVNIYKKRKIKENGSWKIVWTNVFFWIYYSKYYFNKCESVDFFVVCSVFRRVYKFDSWVSKMCLQQLFILLGGRVKIHFWRPFFKPTNYTVIIKLYTCIQLKVTEIIMFTLQKIYAEVSSKICLIRLEFSICTIQSVRTLNVFFRYVKLIGMSSKINLT